MKPITATGQGIMEAGQQSEAGMNEDEWRRWWLPRIVTIEQEAVAIVIEELDGFDSWIADQLRAWMEKKNATL